MYRAIATQIKKDFPPVIIINNPIELVILEFEKLRLSDYTPKIEFAHRLEKQGCLGRFHPYYGIIEITDKANINEAAQIIAHELAHVLDLTERGFPQNENFMQDMTDHHNPRWEYWFERLSSPISPLKLDIKIEFAGQSINGLSDTL
jgi:hypothetical protein